VSTLIPLTFLVSGFFVATRGRDVLVDVSCLRLPVRPSFLRLPGGTGVMSTSDIFTHVGASVATSSFVSCDRFVVGLEIVRKLGLVLGVRWCERRNMCLVFECSLVGGVLSVRAASSTSSSQHSTPQTI
jgi:hypothetical protein